MGISVYQLGDIAELLGVEVSRVKNWTIGRPFLVRPSLRDSEGKGSRKLFGVTDLYCFALIKHFLTLDAPVPAIQHLLDSPSIAKELFWLTNEWVTITRWVGEDRYEIGLHNNNPCFSVTETYSRDAGFYAVNLKPITKELSLSPDNYLSPMVRSAISALSDPQQAADFPTTPTAEVSLHPEPSTISRPNSQPALGVRRKYVRTKPSA